MKPTVRWRRCSLVLGGKPNGDVWIVSKRAYHYPIRCPICCEAHLLCRLLKAGVVKAKDIQFAASSGWR